MSERKGRIVKWIGDNERGWGLINSYQQGSTTPDKFFIHISMIKNQGFPIYAGLRVSFIPGPPRSEKELPTALETYLLDVPNGGAL
jgi:hypothetical protein